MKELLNNITEIVDITTFLGGMLAGAFAVIVLQVLCQFIMRHWRPLLVLSAIIGSISLLIIAL